MNASSESSDFRQVDLKDFQPVQKPATSPLSAAMRISAVPLKPDTAWRAARALRAVGWACHPSKILAPCRQSSGMFSPQAIVRTRDPTRFGETNGLRVSYRDTETFELARAELDALTTLCLLKKKTADE
jgi:hypothetical protein